MPDNHNEELDTYHCLWLKRCRQKHTGKSACRKIELLIY